VDACVTFRGVLEAGSCAIGTRESGIVVEAFALW
jgi:hypothetical protein